MRESDTRAAGAGAAVVGVAVLLPCARVAVGVDMSVLSHESVCVMRWGAREQRDATRGQAGHDERREEKRREEKRREEEEI